MNIKKQVIQISAYGFLAAFLAGCATEPVATTTKEYTYFPPAPDAPRIQFLKAFASDTDFSRGGTFTEYLTGEQKAAKPLIKPYGLAMHAGKIFVCDTVAGVVEVFDMQTHRASYFTPQGEGMMRLPVNITIDTDGTRYVADSGRNQVLIYNSSGSYLGAIGKQGELRPVDVALTADRIYIADLKGHCVQVYSKANRTPLQTIPAAQAGPGKLFSPTNLAVDKERGHLLVSDTGAFAVQVYDLDGNHLQTIGGQGLEPGRFARPKGVAVDREGHVYVVDAATQVAQVFDTDGKLLMYFGQAGASPQGDLILPAAIKIDYDNVDYFKSYVAPGRQIEFLIFVTSQFGGQKVGVYGFLKP